MTLEADFVVSRRALSVAVELTLENAESLALFGPSGAGKTTILEAIAGTTPLDSGEVWLDGRLVNHCQRDRRRRRPGPVAPRHAGIALVRQPTTVFPHLSVGDNVSYGTKVTNADEVLEKVGLGGLSKAAPMTLSGGQRQRLALARALGRPFRLLLMDEPLSAIDVRSRPALVDMAAQAARANGASAVLVTHDLQEAQAFGEQMALIDEGAILQIGQPDVMARAPTTARAAELLGYSTLLPRDDKTAWAIHPHRCVEGDRPDLGVTFSGRVTRVRTAGVGYSCEITTATGQCVEVHAETAPRVGGPLSVTALDPPLVARVLE